MEVIGKDIIIAPIKGDFLLIVDTIAIRRDDINVFKINCIPYISFILEIYLGHF